jgi:hypothetical protein
VRDQRRWLRRKKMDWPKYLAFLEENESVHQKTYTRPGYKKTPIMMTDF